MIIFVCVRKKRYEIAYLWLSIEALEIKLPKRNLYKVLRFTILPKKIANL